MLKKMLAALFLCCMLIVPIGSNTYAWFESNLAYNSNYRPIGSGDGLEYYVDLSSIHTIKNTNDLWIFNVNEFTSLNDSGEIGKVYTMKYKIHKDTNEVWVDYDNGKGWNYLSMNQNLRKWQTLPFCSVNFCYAYMYGHYLSDHNNVVSRMGSKYKGE